MALAQRFEPRSWRGWLMALSQSSSDMAGSTRRDGDAIARNADATNFEDFIRQHERAVLGYLWRMLDDEQTALDLAQETFVRAWQHYATIRDYREPRAWLFRVASNLALSHLRHKAGPTKATIVLDEAIGPSTSDHARRLVEQDLVRQVLDQLPARRRAVLVLREVYGLSCEQIAQTLDMTASAVRASLSRAREQFRSIYTQEER